MEAVKAAYTEGKPSSHPNSSNRAFVSMQARDHHACSLLFRKRFSTRIPPTALNAFGGVTLPSAIWSFAHRSKRRACEDQSEASLF